MPQQFIGQSSSPLNNNINTAVILAAGRGERIAGGEEYKSKPLIKLYDLSLIERSIKKLSNKLKVNKIYVITGFKHDELKIYLDKLKRKLTVDLEVVFAKEWEKGNGASFLSVLNHIKQKQFYLLMADHIFNDEFYSTISKSKINNTKCYLIISKSYHRCMIIMMLPEFKSSKIKLPTLVNLLVRWMDSIQVFLYYIPNSLMTLKIYLKKNFLP